MQLALETFDRNGSGQTAVANPANSRLYQEGFAAGLAEAATQFETDQLSLKAIVANEIADMSFGFTEARAHILSQITPLLQSILTVILPSVQSVSLKAMLLELVTDALAIDTNAPVRLTVHPDQERAMTDALAGVDHPNLVLHTDRNLKVHAAIATLCTGETSLDLDAALDLISGVLENMPLAIKR